MKGYKRLTHKDDIYYVDVINDKHEIVCSPKSDNNLCVVLSAQKIVKLLNRLVELENAIESGELCDREEVRKETVREFVLQLIERFKNTETIANCIHGRSNTEINRIIKIVAAEFGAKVE